MHMRQLHLVQKKSIICSHILTLIIFIMNIMCDIYLVFLIVSMAGDMGLSTNGITKELFT